MACSLLVCVQCYGFRGIRPIRFEDSIRKRIGRPIRFEIRFEQKNDSQVPRQKVDKIKTVNKFKDYMFEVSALRTNTSSKKSFAPLINSHVYSRVFKPAPNFNQSLLQFVDGVDFPLVYTTLHDVTDLVIN